MLFSPVSRRALVEGRGQTHVPAVQQSFELTGMVRQAESFGEETGSIKVEIALHVALSAANHISSKAFKSDCNPSDSAGYQ